MARRARNDAPDTWHHVMNRGIARRPVFENDRDRRFFLALLAREARSGRIEVHAYCLMLTHWHLLVRSVTGELSVAMHRIQMRYARWFNRTRRRDGPLFRGRYCSRYIDSIRYRRNVIVYIHDNPVAAGVVSDSTEHEWTSARRHVTGMRPLWLSGEWVDGVLGAAGSVARRVERFEAAFPTRQEPEFREWIEKQLSQRALDDPEDVTLKHAGSPRVVHWAIRKSKLADATRPFRPVLEPNKIERVIARSRRNFPALRGCFKHAPKCAWAPLRAGLLRLLAGCTHREIGLRVGRHATTVCRDLQDHRRLLRVAPRYAALASQLASVALASN